MCWLNLPVHAEFAGGTGKVNDPYEIATAEQLLSINDKTSLLKKHYVLVKDIDLDPNLPGGQVFDRAVIMRASRSSERFGPGPLTEAFTGTFNGNGHLIRNLSISGTEHLGLFSAIGQGAEVYDLGLVDVQVTGTGDYVGALVGRCAGTVTHCYSTGMVAGNNAVGGLVGFNDAHGSISNSYSTGAVSGVSNIGGLVGQNEQGSVIDCYCAALVSGETQAGGLVGRNADQDMVINCFWDREVSGLPIGNGLGTADMQTMQTFLDAGWDFVGETLNGSEDRWRISEGSAYPRLWWQKYGGGTGDSNDPYQIATAEDLIRWNRTYDDRDKHFILMADIDLDPDQLQMSVDRSALIWNFCGSFDGNGFVITNLRLVGGSRVGLFGILANGARVFNLGITDAHIVSIAHRGQCHDVGILAGCNRGTVYNCYTTGRIQADFCADVGGMLGSNTGTVIHCHSDVTIKGASNAGGLVGYNRGAVTHSYSHGIVRGDFNVGGLVGANGNMGEFFASSASGCVTCCYSTAAVKGNGRVGGLAGGGANIRKPGMFVGTVVRSFWDTQRSGQATSVGGTGKTTVEMQDAQVYLSAGWDWTDETRNGISEVWRMPEEGAYPVLAKPEDYTTAPLQGLGTAANPYTIVDARDLGAMLHHSPCAHFQLADSIDLGGIHWAAPLIPSFSGTFDGNGHTISNLRIEGGGFLGFFGVLELGASVKGLRIVEASVIGSGDHVGGLVGMNSRILGDDSLTWSTMWDDATLSDCAFHGEVTGGSCVGGLLGSNQRGVVTDCYAAALVSGDEAVGGLVGMNVGLLANCYSNGSVDAQEFVGGLVGKNQYEAMRLRPDLNYLDAIVNCYSVSSVTGSGLTGGLVGYDEGRPTRQSFWGMEMSGQDSSAGGMGLSTTEMQSVNTFLSASWDFVDEIENGTDDIWWIDEGLDYPRLWWEEK